MSLLGKLTPRWNLKVEKIGEKDFDSYRREHLTYTVGDGKIEAYVLVPKEREGLLPAVLAIHPGRELGQYELGKSQVAGEAGDKQFAFGVELCKKGYVVMIPDRFGFESRRLVPRGSKSAVDSEDKLMVEATCGFLLKGSTLLGRELMELWAAVSYLQKRPDVFYTRVGVMGYGEGGLLATTLAFINEEILSGVSADGMRQLSDWKNKSGVCDLVTVQGLQEWGDIDEILASIYPRPHLGLSCRTTRKWYLENLTNGTRI